MFLSLEFQKSIMRKLFVAGTLFVSSDHFQRPVSIGVAFQQSSGSVDVMPKRLFLFKVDVAWPSVDWERCEKSYDRQQQEERHDVADRFARQPLPTTFIGGVRVAYFNLCWPALQ